MKMIPTNQVKTASEAEDIAIEWQHWASNQDMSYDELLKWQVYFEALAHKFNLTDVFKENAII